TGGATIAPATSESIYLVLTGPAFEYATVAPLTTADVALQGDPEAGQIWALVFNGRTYTYEVQVGDELVQVAAGLVAKLTTDGVAAGLDATDDTIIEITGLFVVSFVVSGSGVDDTDGALISGDEADVTVGSQSRKAWL